MSDIVTTIIAAYSPCKPRKNSLLSSYAQQTRYWDMQGMKICAKNKCIMDLVQFIRDIKQDGENIILIIDGN